MRVHTKIVIEICSGKVIKDQCFDYRGPVARAFGGGGGQKTQATSTGQLPEEFKPLVSASVAQTIPLQEANPLSSFISANPQLVPGLTPAQMTFIGGQESLPFFPTLTGPEINALRQMGNITGPLNRFTQPQPLEVPELTPGQETFTGIEQLLPFLSTLTGGEEFALGEAANITGPTAPFRTAQPLNVPGLTPGQELFRGATEALPFLPKLTTGEEIALGQAANITGPTAPFRTAQPLNVPGLTPSQQTFLGAQESLPFLPTLTGEELAGLDVLSPLVSGPLGSSPATTAAMQAWDKLVRPRVLQQEALRGTLFGGAADEAIAQSSSEAAIPFIQQEIQNRMAAVPMLEDIGRTRAGRMRSDIQTALQAAGMPREVALQQANAQLADVLRRQGLAENEIQSTLSALPTIERIGGTEATRMRSDIAAALQAAGLPRDVALQQANAQLADTLRRQGVAEQEIQSTLQALPTIERIGGTEAARFRSDVQAALEAAGLPRQIAVQKAQAAHDDMLRRQGVAETGITATENILPLELGVDGTQATRFRQDLQTALEAAGIPREVAAQQAETQFRDFLRRQQLAEETTLGPITELVPRLIGTTQTSRTTPTGGGFLGTVICSELYRQGLLDEQTYYADGKFADSVGLDVLAGYWRWGIPVARAMGKSKIITRIVAFFALPWAKEMRFQVEKKGVGSRFGRVLMKVGIPICRWLGKHPTELAKEVIDSTTGC